MVHQAVTLVTYLPAHPRRTIHEIAHHLHANHGGRGITPSYVIHYARNVLGHDVVCCEYDDRRGRWVYWLAVTANEGNAYLFRRGMAVKSEVGNLVGIADRI